jgi:hypothetical protein
MKTPHRELKPTAQMLFAAFLGTEPFCCRWVHALPPAFRIFFRRQNTIRAGYRRTSPQLGNQFITKRKSPKPRADRRDPSKRDGGDGQKMLEALGA